MLKSKTALCLLICIAYLISDGLVAWPENARVGYTSCVSCHVSPSGGGVLTEYGKALSTEFSTFSQEKHGNSDWGLFKTSKHILVGGNMRNVYLKQQAGEFDRERSFLMQADLELALVLGQFSFVGLAGVYGLDHNKIAKRKFIDSDQDQVIEYRRYYTKVQVNDNTILRAGKFFPNFGLMIDDHMEEIRTAVGYGQNQETHNFEAGFYNELFGFIISLAYPDDSKKPKDIYKFEGYVGKTTNVSISLQDNNKDDNDLAFAVATGLSRNWYVMSEILMQSLMNDYYYFRSGYEVYRGLIPYFKYSKGQREVWSYGAQILPFAHFELLLETSLAKDYGDINIITNYYW